MKMTGHLWPYRGILPTVHESAFVAPGTHVIGDVHVGAQASLWFNCVVRGDVHSIRIGARSNVQDGSVVHVTGGRFGTFIGEDVLIGHQCMIHGCRIENEAFVGMGATVMDGCVIEPGGMLGAGSLLAPGRIIKPGQLWLGRPARHVRDLTPEEVEANRTSVRHYVNLAAAYRAVEDRAEPVSPPTPLP
jgi:carbonic anhydrase/acetyltransferase-like protein (isoleucine patch superfamily)